MTNLKYYLLLMTVCFVHLSSQAQTGRKDDNFHKALMEWNVEEIKKELEADVDLDSYAKHYRDPLSIVAEHGDLEMFKYMIARDSTIRSRHLFDSAVKGGNMEILKYVVEVRKMKYYHQESFNPVWYAVENDNREMAVYLLDTQEKTLLGKSKKLHYKALNKLTQNRDTALINRIIPNGKMEYVLYNSNNNPNFFKVAATNNDFEMMQFYINKGYDVKKNSTTPKIFREAIEKGSMDLIEFLVKNGASVNERDRFAHLFTAVINNQENITKYLLEQGANINIRINPSSYDYDLYGNNNCSPLAIAAINKNERMMNLLMEYQPDSIRLKDDVLNAIDATSNTRCIESLKFLLKYSGQIKDPTQFFWSAIYAEKAESVKFWLDYGIPDLEIDYMQLHGYRSHFYQTPLMEVSRMGNLDIVKILIQHGADITKKDVQNKTVFLFAVQNGNLELIKYLLEQGANINDTDYRKQNALSIAAYEGHTEVISFLLANGFDVNTKDKYQRTPLILANMQSFNEMDGIREYDDLEDRAYRTSKLLIENGANIGSKDFEGMTALMFSINRGYPKAVEYLLQKGAKLKDKNKFGDTPAMFFYFYPYYGEDREEKEKQFLKLIKIDDLEKKAPVKRKSQWKKDEDLLTAFGENNLTKVKKALVAGASFFPDWEQDYMGDMTHRALNANVDNAILKVLIDNGSSVKSGNMHGTTSLMRVAMGNDCAMAKYFIDKGADVNSFNEYRNTALIFAAKSGNVDMINLLLEHGAETNWVGNGGTALDKAIEFENESAIKLLQSKGAKSIKDCQEFENIPSSY